MRHPKHNNPGKKQSQEEFKKNKKKAKERMEWEEQVNRVLDDFDEAQRQRIKKKKKGKK